MLSLEDEIMDDEIFSSQADDPEATAMNNDAVERLTVYVRQMSPAMRQVFEYRYIEGYSNKEIADILGISQSAVSTRLEKARTRLKEQLGSEGE